MRSGLLLRLLSLLVGVAAPIAAQEATMAHNDDDGNCIVTTRILLSGGAQTGVGLGFARVELTNHDTRAHRVAVAIKGWNRRSAGVISTRTLVLEPGSQRFFLPVQVPPMVARCEVSVDGVTHVIGTGYGSGIDLVGLLLSDRSGTKGPATEVLEALPSPAGATVSPFMARPADVPRDWRLLVAFPVVIVDGRTGVDSELQETLRRYAFAGGVVVVAGPDLLPAGPLRDRVRRLEQEVAGGGRAGHGSGRFGLGHLVAIPPLGERTGTMRARVAELPQLGDALLPVAWGLFAEQDIAGLGRAPVTVFVLVILLFAILVGPVNFLVLRRRRQPLLALVTVPVLGFGTTLCILAYGILHDGFGVRGAVTSWTLLDQVRHEAATVTARTLFAGLAPSDFILSRDSLVLSQRACQRDRDAADRWQWDGDRDRLDGALLPSRTVTPLVSLQQGTVRERLTVRIEADVAQVLADGGIEPVGPMVLRDLDGRYWAGEDGRLAPVDAAAGAAMFERLRLQFGAVRLRTDGGFERHQVPVVLPEWGGPGTYAATVRSAPWIDEHGLEVDYDHAAHRVFGRMHAQDFQR